MLKHVATAYSVDIIVERGKRLQADCLCSRRRDDRYHQGGAVHRELRYHGSAQLNNPHTLTATATNTFGLPATTRTSFNTNNGTAAARTFYIATNGNDANPGTAAQPWATPDHALRCGDTIAHSRIGGTSGPARPQTATISPWICNGTYVQSCLFTNSVVGTSIMVVNSSNWLVRGVTAVNNVQYGGCFGGWRRLHRFVNVYAKNCGAGTGTSGQDYVAYVGSLFYGGAGLGGQCFSNLAVAIHWQLQ